MEMDRKLTRSLLLLVIYGFSEELLVIRGSNIERLLVMFWIYC